VPWALPSGAAIVIYRAPQISRTELKVGPCSFTVAIGIIISGARVPASQRPMVVFGRRNLPTTGVVMLGQREHCEQLGFVW